MSTTQPDGYLALPPTGNGEPVLVLHAWWGLNDTLKSFCNRLAQAGFVVFAPDLYHGKVATTIADAETLGQALDTNYIQARAEVADAAVFVMGRAESNESGITVIGFSLGTFYALDLSARMPDTVRSVVLFYGTGPADFNLSRAEYLGHFAANDPYEPLSNVNELEQAMKDAGRPVTFYTYPDTGHWFFEPDRADAYNPAAASLAWERTLAFMKRTSV